ncbi:nicotinic acid mononucleotide adenylyltransferase [Thioclava sp. SK-1]|uniref:nicotinate-nucleotide adenylyltransferase n=1 Tax=Thioclava sp. SK-1 TaxID=1889770 RepID=UPI0008244605|nr:nicotinate-nucleotide adenylyltransferase [Thioclava sp. SK-1]OCX66459.1 nicotinic acid mononucleotide adenylyltransferase [Thioclava sp. SK-1]
MKTGFPIARSGMTIGLLGGSFDPAHEGHAHITREALRRFNLDRVWWLLTPGNPLKTHGPAPMDQRLQMAQDIMPDPRVSITDLERHLGTRYTAQTLARLRALYPAVRFVWLMGADNLVQIHRWDDWKQIFGQVPIGILARPGSRMRARRSVAAQIFGRARMPAAEARLLAQSNAPAWCFVDMPMSDLSSSAIRAGGAWRVGKPPA